MINIISFNYINIYFSITPNLLQMSSTGMKIALGVVGAVAIAGLGYLIHNFKNQDQDQVDQQNREEQLFDIDLEIQKLKAQVNLLNPSLEDIKKILVFSFDASKKEIFKFSKNFKNDRRKYNKQKRNQNLDQYLRMVAQGMTRIQQIGMSLQQQIMMKIGITEQHFTKYQYELGGFLQEQMMSQGIGSSEGKQLTLEEVKRALNLQIQYMEQHGDEMVNNLLQTCSGWNQQQKSLVPTLISVYIADQVFENHPEIDQDALQGAEMKFQTQLQNQMLRLQQVMAPMMGQLTQGLGFGGMGGMGGMEGMGGMGGMGGMDMGGMGGPTLQQLQQLRLQDPAAFQQLMQMMSQGMR